MQLALGVIAMLSLSACTVNICGDSEVATLHGSGTVSQTEDHPSTQDVSPDVTLSEGL